MWETAPAPCLVSGVLVRQAWCVVWMLGRHCFGAWIAQVVSSRPDPMPSICTCCPPPAGAFRAWCSEAMRGLTGSADVTLCEFLLTVESNSEVAEYCTLYLGNSPAVRRREWGQEPKRGMVGGSTWVLTLQRVHWSHLAPSCLRQLLLLTPCANPPPPPSLPQVARFASEFMKRKLAEAAAAKSGKSRKAKAKAAASAAAVAAPTPAAASRPAAAGPPGYAPPEAAFPSLGAPAKVQPAKKDADWEKASEMGSCVVASGCWGWACDGMKSGLRAGAPSRPQLDLAFHLGLLLLLPSRPAGAQDRGRQEEEQGGWRGPLERRQGRAGLRSIVAKRNTCRPAPPSVLFTQLPSYSLLAPRSGQEAGWLHAGLCQWHQLRAAGAAGQLRAAAVGRPSDRAAAACGAAALPAAGSAAGG